MIDGILLIDKQEGITSYDVIRKLKWVFEKGQKIGHAGTLDPFATGLLIVLLGRATKLMNTFHTFEKEYLVDAQLGFCTDTQDITGKVVERNESIKPSLEDIEGVIKKELLGDISQTPPMYSAKKVDGKKAYEIAREGRTVELQARDITVSKYDVVKYEYPYISCNVLCSTGTYIRTLIDDLGKKLGSYATATTLRRVNIGDYNVKDALSSQKISTLSEEEILKYVIDISKVRSI